MDTLPSWVRGACPCFGQVLGEDGSTRYSRVSSDVTRSHLDLTIGAEPVEESMTLSNKSGGRDAESTKGPLYDILIGQLNEMTKKLQLMEDRSDVLVGATRDLADTAAQINAKMKEKAKVKDVDVRNVATLKIGKELRKRAEGLEAIHDALAAANSAYRKNPEGAEYRQAYREAAEQARTCHALLDDLGVLAARGKSYIAEGGADEGSKSKNPLKMVKKAVANEIAEDITRGLEAARDALGNTDTLKLLQEFIDLPDPNTAAKSKMAERAASRQATLKQFASYGKNRDAGL